MKVATLICSLLMCVSALSQLPMYYVYLVKGDVKVERQKNKPTSIKQAELLFKDDQLIIAKNAEVTLVNKDAKYLAVNKEGKFKISDVVTNMHTSYTGVTKKYINLLWHELLDPNYDYSKYKLKNVAGVYGGVTRGGDDCEGLIFPIKGLKATSDSIQFVWKKTSPINQYELSIQDINNQEVFKKILSDTQYVSVKNNLALKSGKYMWQVKSYGVECDMLVPYIFEILSKEEIEKQIKLYSDQSSDPSLIDQLQLIDILEKGKFFYLASAKYTDLISKYPNNNVLKRSYEIFLSEYGLEVNGMSSKSL